MVSQGKQWTILGYLAGDNNLASAALTDIQEMEAVGSTNDINVVVQIDHAADYNTGNDAWRSTRRYFINKGSNPTKIESTLLKDLGETNTGDPAVIQDFLGTSIQDYPAEKTMVVFWNHGSGYYVPPDILNTDGQKGATSRELGNTKAATAMKRSFFSTTRRELLQISSQRVRGICYDDSSRDCLDNRELKQILRFAQDRLAGRKIEVLGMDACLMTMIEVAYQVKDYARFLVGSEETEPANGWPYNTILGDLAKNPGMDGAALCTAIVNRYVESYGPGQDITQAALDLSKLGDITTAVGALAKAILKAPLTEDLQDSLWLARKRSTSFYDDMYVDIHHLALNITKKLRSGAIHAAADDVMNVIEGKKGSSPIIAEKHAGARMKYAKGLSIYWPFNKMPSTYYENLDFAGATGWGDLLKTFGVG